MKLIAQLTLLPTETATLADGSMVQFRRAGNAAAPVSHVLLHGIGSASASWLAQLQAAQHCAHADVHVLAWDAPGYGGSTPVAPAAPTAADYAVRLWAWLDGEPAATRPLTLVGHSLGAMMAAAATCQMPRRVGRLVLLAPALGYASASTEQREKKLADRLANLATLGPAGMAHARAPAMLSEPRDADQLAFVEHVMAAIDPAGYTQAARMLAGGNLLADLRQVRCPVTVASGSADTITPAPACQALAVQIAAPYITLGAVGHSCALQAADRVNGLLQLRGDRT